MTIQPLTAPAKVLATLLGGVLALSASTAFARTIYDGPWSVLIITKSGACDATYRYGVEITDGNVVYQGVMVTLQGRVTRKGAVRVIVQAGSQSADGSGRLTRNKGGGIWTGQSLGGMCTGIWQAEREPS